MTLVTIRQPGFIPYMGFFKKIQTSDIFVYLDDAQYAIRAWDNRNKIRTNENSCWISVPVIHPFGKKLNEVKISYSKNWINNHKNLIEINYKTSPYFKNYWPEIESIFNKKFEKLLDLNLELIKYFNKILQINTVTKRSSELKIETIETQRLFDICKKLNASVYRSGSFGKKYLDESIFEKGKISIIYEKFEHPTYSQLKKEFIPNLSIIDLLFHEGENAIKILNDCTN